MKRFFIFLGLLAALAVGIDTFGRGFGGGGGGHSFGGGGFGGGFGGASHSFGGGGEFHGGFTPSFGGDGAARQSWGGNAAFSRPSYIPQSRPSFAQNYNFNNFDRGSSNFNRGVNNFDRSDFNRSALPENRSNFSQNFGSNFDRGRQALVNRPSFNGDNPFAQNIHPGEGIGNRPNIADNVHPNWSNGNRPNNGPNHPDINNRPIVNNHPNIGNNLNIGNNVNINRNNNWTNNRNWNNNINHWANNHPWNHPWYNHYDGWHHDWHHGYWPYWGQGYYPWAWFGVGAGLGWWATPGTTYVYNNPYYVVADDSDGGFDYGQPIPPPAEQEPPQLAEATTAGLPPPDASDASATFADTTSDPNTQQAVQIFDSGRALFKQSDYQGALDKVDQAIKLLPSDATLHEFRALCLFALKQYQEAAATIYAVLAAGPGWDWDTMKALYPDTSVYTTQLRDLEAYKKANPDKPDASFLLAYHYLVLGYPDQAAQELEQVVKLQPNDKLSAAILKALQDRNNPQQQQAAPTPTTS
jgi:hypothetical protein